MRKIPQSTALEFDASKPHTLADFIRYSRDVGIVVRKLPQGIEPAQAEKILEQRNDISLRPLPVNVQYFAGWYGEKWVRRIYTTDGVLLFTITIGDRHESRFHFLLTVEAATRRLLLGAKGYVAP